MLRWLWERRARARQELTRTLLRAEQRLATGEVSEALADYEAAATLAPRLMEPRLVAAWLLAGLGRDDEARERFAGAREAAPRRPEPWLESARFELHRARWSEALAMADEALRRRPPPPAAHRLRGLALVRLNRADEGLTALRRAVALAPEDADSLHDLALALVAAGQEQEVPGLLRRYLAAAPDDDPRRPGAERLAAHLRRRQAEEETA
jgi:tetratricopeptide (TPR) repeat protein